jgi:hypothetical protein
MGLFYHLIKDCFLRSKQRKGFYLALDLFSNWKISGLRP